MMRGRAWTYLPLYIWGGGTFDMPEFLVVSQPALVSVSQTLTHRLCSLLESTRFFYQFVRFLCKKG